MENLKAHIRTYRQLDDQIREINKVIYDKRKARNDIESQIVSIVSQPQFIAYDRLKIEDDGSVLKIKRPETWNKPWALSKASLKKYLEDYFSMDRDLNSERCFQYIVSQVSKECIGKEVIIERFISSAKEES